jgi:hypothetical protein
VAVVIVTVTMARRGLIISAVLLLVAPAGCRTDPTPDTKASARPSLSAPSKAASSQDPRAAVQNGVNAYRKMWGAYTDAAHVSNPASAELARYATGEALKTFTGGLQSLKDQGLKGAGSVVLAPQVTEVAPAAVPMKISIRDCVDTSGSSIVRASPGPPYQDTPGGRRLTLATVEHQSDGSWKVSTFALRAVGTC